ncbi:MAG TPA: glycoside hydrolase domain-containing protein [Arachidicoccus soli]|nr:glycoside hydrolase domain-containing protein [Arachidicoccus soli]
MKRIIATILVLACTHCFAQKIPFTVSKKLWIDSLGNHRVVLQVDKNTDAAEVKVDWRRRDRDADKKAFIITNEKGEAVKNIFIKKINRETGDFIFEPNSGAGKYYVYYLPWSGHKWEGGFQGDYLRNQPEPNENWVEKNHLSSTNISQAKVMGIQARTSFDSFYPMEVVAKESEVKSLILKHKTDDYLIFPENRKHAIRMLDDLPLRWIQSGPSNQFSGTAERNEYYVFQLGVFASTKDLKNIEATYENSPFPITCFNLGGVDSKGNDFKKTVNVNKGKVQPLWFGVDIPQNAKTGNYSFSIKIKAAHAQEKTVHIKLIITNQILKDRGDDDLWRLSRLRWLNSRAGIDDKNTRNYLPLQVNNYEIKATTANVVLDRFGLPKTITINHKQILSQPISFLIKNKTKDRLSISDLQFIKKASGIVEWKNIAENNFYKITYIGSMESDGYLHYKIQIIPKKDFIAENILLNLPIVKNDAIYFMGMGSGKPFGRNGGYTPTTYNWKWHGPQDAYWIGNYDAGIYCKLLGATYSGPMLNLYHPAPPPSWYNNNNGGFSINTDNGIVNTSTFTGEISLKKDSTIDFAFSLLITPVKKLDTKAQFANRYYQNYGNPYPPEADIKAGVNVINVHHANRVNPYINYPFVRADSMKAFVDKYHKENVKTKIYYTIRELSNQCAEIWALRSLGTEVYSDGNGGGYPWLREHLVNHYDVQWFTPINGYEACDAAIRTSGDSRWYNYYVEGLRWLVKNTGIDGLYLDDVAYDRSMLKRMRKVMESVKPGCIIDLHSNTDFSKGPATQYTEFFPYIDKLWFGENFHYEKMQPDNWMVETSGIPFGLMGDMLFSGGNPWRGLVYGMTNRDGWPTDGKICNPKPIWRALDKFGIKNAKMIGYWQPGAIVTTSNKKILATTYENEKKLLIAIASWDADTTSVSLNIDWGKLGFTPKKNILTAWPIDDFQKAKTFNLNDKILIEPGKGWLLDVE